MRWIALIALAVLGSIAVWLWGYGGADVVSRWAAATQRDVQNGMAASLRALRAGEAGALVGLWTLCLTYGFVHAAGPGHGKLVIGGYGLGVRVSATKLAGLAALSSLAQAASAVVFVGVAVAILGWGRAQMTAVADQTLAPISYALVAVLGVWIALRGIRKLWRRRAAHEHHHDHSHDHHHDHDHICEDCGHAHAPTPTQAAAVHSWRDAIAVIAVIAARPCTGTIFLLILTYALDVFWAGVIGAFVMGIGTAALTAMVAFAAVGARESTLAQAASAKGTATLLAIAEFCAGALIAAVAAQLLWRLIG